MRVEGLGFRVEGLGLRVEGLGFRVEGLGSRVSWWVLPGYNGLGFSHLVSFSKTGPRKLRRFKINHICQAR